MSHRRIKSIYFYKSTEVCYALNPVSQGIHRYIYSRKTSYHENVFFLGRRASVTFKETDRRGIQGYNSCSSFFSHPGCNYYYRGSGRRGTTCGHSWSYCYCHFIVRTQVCSQFFYHVHQDLLYCLRRLCIRQDLLFSDQDGHSMVD